MRAMRLRFSAIFVTCLLAGGLAPRAGAQKPPAVTSRGRVLLLPRRIVSGERATLAVLDSNGRLTAGATVNFSNGDQLTTDATGRALFVAPLTPGTMLASIAGRTGHVATTILGSAEAASSSIEITAAPTEASLTDRFEISGRGFCGEADANQVNIGGQAALVLASSPTSLIVLPPIEMKSGAAAVTVSCAKHSAPAFRTTFVTLELEADSSPLKPGEHRSLTVRVRGTLSKMVFEARNLAPDVAELSGGNVVQRSSNGGTNNVARFDLLGRRRGSFLVSIRLVPQLGRPAPAH